MALTCAVVAYDQDALGVGSGLELKIRDHQIAQLFGHALRDNERLNEVPDGGG